MSKTEAVARIAPAPEGASEENPRAQFDHTGARHYDFYNTSKKAQQEVNFLLKYILPSGNVLDVSAGTGRIALPLAEHNLEVVAVEPSARMTDALYIKAANNPAVHPYFTPIHADPLDFKLDRKFSLVLFYWAFRYVKTREERVAVIKNLAAHLKPEGRLIVDCPIGEEKEGTSEVSRHRLGLHEYRTLWTNKREAPINNLTFAVETWEGERLLETNYVYTTYTDVPSVKYFAEILEEAGLEVMEYWDTDDDDQFVPIDPAGECDYALLVARLKG